MLEQTSTSILFIRTSFSSLIIIKMLMLIRDHNQPILETKEYRSTIAIFQDHMLSKMISLIFQQLKLAFPKQQRQRWKIHNKKWDYIKLLKEILPQHRKKLEKNKHRLKSKTEGKFRNMFSQQNLLLETSRTLNIRIISEEQLCNLTAEAIRMSLLGVLSMEIIRKLLMWTHTAILTSLNTINHTQQP